MKPLNRAAKGARLEKLAKEWLGAQGYHVELSGNSVKWIPDKATGKMIPISNRRDFFGCFDGFAVNGFERFLFQVGVWDDAAHKRAQVARSPFKPQPQDRILLYYGEGSRSRHFRVLRAPEFRWEGECLMPAKDGF